jgi:hypothetical protein
MLPDIKNYINAVIMKKRIKPSIHFLRAQYESAPTSKKYRQHQVLIYILRYLQRELLTSSD